MLFRPKAVLKCLGRKLNLESQIEPNFTIKPPCDKFLTIGACNTARLPPNINLINGRNALLICPAFSSKCSGDAHTRNNMVQQSEILVSAPKSSLAMEGFLPPMITANLL
jgi:hypothetical protein